MQTFVLARQGKTFYLHTDIFHFQDYVLRDVVSSKSHVEPGLPMFYIVCRIVENLFAEIDFLVESM